MATPVVSGALVRASVVMSLYGDINDVVNTFWFQTTAAADLDNLATTMLATGNIVSAITHGAAASLSVSEINISEFYPVSGGASNSYPVIGRNGAISVTQPAAPATAAVVKLTTGVGGRAHRGRVFTAAVDPNQTAGGVLIPAAIASNQTAWDDAVAGYPASNFVWVVAHTRVKNPAYQPNTSITPFDLRRTLPVTPPTALPVLRAVVMPVLRQQRRREIGVSRHGARGGARHS